MLDYLAIFPGILPLAKGFLFAQVIGLLLIGFGKMIAGLMGRLTNSGT